ncbi:rRNA adenine N-6-methyltransferase family protein [Streptomyces rubiginosohelvolus]|uniref:rRNA adenine N-6-methyltransferase family protein n=1 Tax=Streptomyces rubiginosohelvolus TaxID=67362 RepID=UPI0036BC5AF1
MQKSLLRKPENLHAADRLAAGGFQTRADLGQHFLRSPESARRLVSRASLPSGGQVLEVGAGLGTLSATIAEAGHRIWAVEKDPRMGGRLSRALAQFGDRGRVTIADVRGVDLDQGLDEGSALLAIMPFDAALAADLVLHVFSSSRLVRGLVVLPSAGLARLEAGSAGVLRVEEVDGISRSDFWPPAPEVLRVVALERSGPCRR